MIDIPSIARDKTPDGPEPPSLEAHDGPDPATVVTDPCPHCGERHVHGASDDPKSHRTAHCPKDTPGRGLGYYLLRPLRGLLNLPLKWWRSRANDEARDLGFRGSDDGVGLLLIEEKLDEIRQHRGQDREADRE